MELQQSFSEAMEQHIRYLSPKAAEEIAVKQEVDRQGLAKRDLDKTQKMIDQAFIRRNTVGAVFKTLVDEARHLLNTSNGKTQSLHLEKFSKR